MEAGWQSCVTVVMLTLINHIQLALF